MRFRFIFLYLGTFFCVKLFAQTLPIGFNIESVASELNPTTMVQDHHGRIWTVDKGGEIWIIEPDNELVADPLLSIEVDDFNERGLLGLALHPDMDNQPFIYVYYTVPDANHNRLSRFEVNGDLAIPGSEEILLDLDPLSSAVHNGGAMLFDKNGYLFIATGEGGRSQNSQDTSLLLGKILRLHDDGSIPEDNPFYNQYSGKNRAIWCLGLRNPFNLAYNEEDDKLYSTDVGGGEYEEINQIEKGKNYGWPIIEGPLINQEPPTNYQDPLYAYDHDQGCAIVGLALYQAHHTNWDSIYHGALFFGDYCSGYIRYINPADPVEAFPFASQMDRPLTMLIEKESGNLLFQSRAGIGGGSPADNTLTESGEIWRIFFTGNGKPTITRQPIGQTLPLGEDATFSVLATGTAPLSYQWFVNGVFSAKSNNNTIVIEEIRSTDDSTLVYCIVSNEDGSDTSETAMLTVTSNTRPLVSITNPIDKDVFQAGDTIYFSGMIQDLEEGVLDTNVYIWQIEQHHNSHTHPVLNLQGVSGGSFIIPTVGETDTTVFIRIQLTGHDSMGLKAISSVDILPDLGTIDFLGSHPADINIDGAIRQLPYRLYSLKGLERIVQVSQKQLKNNQILLFKQWSDGDTIPIKTLVANESSQNYRLSFDSIVIGTGEGLYGEYFNDPEADLDEIPILTRIDSIINFRWGNRSPEKVVDKDHFSVRWRGFLEAIYAEQYTLYLASDDGARLWIDDTLIIDNWRNQSTREIAVDVDFSVIKKRKIKIEYFENAGGAEMILKWSSPSQSKQVIPKSQMYKMEFGDFSGQVWIDHNENQALDPEDTYLEYSIVFLLNTDLGYVSHVSTDSLGQYEFKQLEVGNYFIQIVPNNDQRNLLPAMGLDKFGLSTSLGLTSDTVLFSSFSFIPGNTTPTVDPFPGEIFLFPNPSCGKLYMRNEENVPIENWVLVNSQGQILQKSNSFVSNQSEWVLDISDVPAGNYFVIFYYGVAKKLIEIQKI